MKNGIGKDGRTYFVRIIILSASGAGKRTQAKRIAEKYRIPYISTGDIFQTSIKGGTELGMKAKSFMDQGMLVPDETIIGVLMDRIEDADRTNGYVLDGFLGAIPQAESLIKTFPVQGESIGFVVNVDVPDDNIVSRMARHRACLACGATYHVEFSPPKKEGVCGVCGQELMLHDDDKPGTVRKRLDVYHEQTQPLIEYYKQANVLTEVDGTQNIGDIFSNIVDILGT